MKDLDLHGIFHHEVNLEVENFVLLNSNNLPLRIITGKSDYMRNIVIEILTRHSFEFHIPAHNAGEIIVTSDKEIFL